MYTTALRIAKTALLIGVILAPFYLVIFAVLVYVKLFYAGEYEAYICATLMLDWLIVATWLFLKLRKAELI